MLISPSTAVTVFSGGHGHQYYDTTDTHRPVKNQSNHRLFRCVCHYRSDRPPLLPTAHASARLQARDCGAPASPSDFADGLIRLSLGVVWPNKAALYAVMSLQSEINPKLLNMARELAGGSMIMLPSSIQDFESPEVAADLERYIAPPGFPSKQRVAVLKMAWDLIATEFAGRHEQYEKFYGGASLMVRQNMARSYDFDAATAMVDRVLALPPEYPAAYCSSFISGAAETGPEVGLSLDRRPAPVSIAPSRRGPCAPCLRIE